MSKKERYDESNSDQSDNDNSEDDHQYYNKSDKDEKDSDESEEKENMTYDDWYIYFKEEFEAAFCEHFGNNPSSFKSALQQFCVDIVNWEDCNPMPN